MRRPANRSRPDLQTGAVDRLREPPLLCVPPGSGAAGRTGTKPFRQQLLKWIGNKQRCAHEIAAFFPEGFGTYYEPFLGSAAVLGTIAPRRALGSDAFAPLIGIWRALEKKPDLLISWYAQRVALRHSLGKQRAYAEILASYNARPNSADFL